MPKVFVDTVAWIALINSRDDFHVAARQVMAKLLEGWTIYKQRSD